MALATLLAITIACIGWSLWIRRVTWTCRWEVAATLNNLSWPLRDLGELTADWIRLERALHIDELVYRLE